MEEKMQSFKLHGGKRTRTLAYITIGTVTLIVFLVIYQSISLPGRQRSQAEHIEYVTPQGSMDRTVEEIAVKIMGAQTNWNPGRKRIKLVDKILQTAGPDVGGYSVIVKYRADENLTTSLMKFGIINDAMLFFRSLYLSPYCVQIKVCTLQPFAILTDKYGNKSESQIGALRLRRTISQKINWENMYTDRFEKILEEDPVFWLHSGFY